MAWLELITALALIQFSVFGALVGRARGTYGIRAPAVSGNEMFERYYRVQMNTLEQLVLFLPALWLGGQYMDPRWAAGLGGVYLIGRLLYLRSYLADPARRGLGFALTVWPSVILLVTALVHAGRELLGR
jgi:uncharacterized MAPEG superfamily protein